MANGRFAPGRKKVFWEYLGMAQSAEKDAMYFLGFWYIVACGTKAVD